MKRLTVVECVGFKYETKIFSLSNESEISGEYFPSFVRLKVKGPTEDFSVDCKEFVIGPPST